MGDLVTKAVYGLRSASNMGVYFGPAGASSSASLRWYPVAGSPETSQGLAPGWGDLVRKKSGGVRRSGAVCETEWTCY